uniref:CD177 n=1 Tax=Spermophilus dauricus TaxID=99837 RepID=A0A8C9PLK7_SPEDA
MCAAASAEPPAGCGAGRDWLSPVLFPAPHLGFAFSIPGAQALECKWGAIEALRNVSELPLQWTTGWESCAQGQGCQETVILMVNGPLVNVVLTKGCTEHRTGPGLSVISYTHVCRHRDLCNDLSSSVPLWSLHSEKGVGGVRSSGGGEGRGCLEQGAQG